MTDVPELQPTVFVSISEAAPHLGESWLTELTNRQINAQVLERHQDPDAQRHHLINAMEAAAGRGILLLATHEPEECEASAQIDEVMLDDAAYALVLGLTAMALYDNLEDSLRNQYRGTGRLTSSSIEGLADRGVGRSRRLRFIGKGEAAIKKIAQTAKSMDRSTDDE